MWWFLLIACGPSGPFVLDAVDADGDGFTVAEGDCDDADGSVHPATLERCDGVDNDCDDLVDTEDEGVLDATAGFFDDDEDGWGDSEQPMWACAEEAEEFALEDGDCNDKDPSIHPEAFEECDNGIDENCDGVDPASIDADGDGYDQCLDCDDSDPDFNPDAIDFCDNGLDEDCSGRADDDTGLNTWYGDSDGDGYGTESSAWQSCRSPREDMVLTLGDCDDFDATIHPGAEETWYDGIDQDCAEDDDYDQDRDGDRHDDYGGGDCDDTDPTTSSRAGEKLDLTDHDCDGSVDGGSLQAAAETWWWGTKELYVGTDVDLADVNGDGFGDLLVAAQAEAWVVSGPLAGSGNMGLTTGTAHLYFDEDDLAVVGADLTGDGIDDLVVGAPDAGTDSAYSGGVFLFEGPVRGTMLQDDANMTVPLPDGAWGAGIRLDAADFDDDGSVELLIGGTRTDSTASSGGLWIYEGPLTGTSEPISSFSPGISTNFASSFQPLEDVDGDGRTDLVVGGWQSNWSGTSLTGQAWVFTGPVTAWSLGDAAWDLTSARYSYFGSTVADAEDVDGDGYSDFWVTAPGEDETYLFLGAATPAASSWEDHALVLFNSENATGFFQPLASGDFNGDGDVDVAMGTDQALWLATGPLTGSFDLTEDGLHVTGSASAGAVLQMSDINGDSYADLLVSDPETEVDGYTNAGAVYLLTGSGF